jgi:hypothetical protein
MCLLKDAPGGEVLEEIKVYTIRYEADRGPGSNIAEVLNLRTGKRMEA